MDLYKEIMVKLLSCDTVTVTFQNADINMAEMVESICYKALKRIKEIIDDDTLNDRECFMKIEEIIRTFETIGCQDGFRHDF